MDTIYPSFCQSCKKNKAFNILHLCLHCYVKLSLTNHDFNKENAFKKRIEGRIPVERAYAMYTYSNSPECQSIIKAIKYRNRPKIAFHIGTLLGSQILNYSTLKPEIVIPVPLHRQKLRKRTYNQSVYFGKGLAHVLNIPFNSKALKRTKHTASMTTMNREDRFENIMNAFKPRKKSVIKEKHVLLVDDVITTGATLEACGKCVIESEARSLSLACIAFGKH